MRRAFPDALDLLLICVESGMSIEQRSASVSQEIGARSIPLAEEFTLTTAELSYLPDRRTAYENFAKRTGLDGVKQIVDLLIQAEKYGTPLGTALRVVVAGKPRPAHDGSREKSGVPAAEADRADDHVLPAGSVRRHPDAGGHPDLAQLLTRPRAKKGGPQNGPPDFFRGEEKRRRQRAAASRFIRSNFFPADAVWMSRQALDCEII